jgi:hypothetical protein
LPDLGISHTFESTKNTGKQSVTHSPTNPEYNPANICIYCGATRYSPDRENLGDEHIIPEALNGKLILRRASCGECERRINWFEQYCLRTIFGPIRYHLKMKSKRPNNRPETIPLELLINGQWTKHDVPVELAPVSILFPFFETPEILSGGPPTRTNVYTKQFLHRMIANGDLSKLHDLYGCTRGRTYQATLEGTRFALLLAKIAHSYAVAESHDLDNFNPVLCDTILQHPSAPPLPYMIGGLSIPEANSCLGQELGLLRGDHPILGVVWMVQIRLFGWLGSPTYQVVASVQRLPTCLAMTP